MKAKQCLILLMVVLICGACAKRPVHTTATIAVDPADELFNAAEKRFQFQSYSKALQFYSDYLERYPQRAMAPAALLKTGTIHMVLKDFPEARKAFTRLIKDYPDSAFAADAKFNFLMSLYNENRFEDLINQSDSFLQQNLPREHRVRIYVLQGNAYSAMNAPPEAFQMYLKAYRLVDQPEKKRLLKRLQTSLTLMDPTQMDTALRSVDRLPLKADLLYNLGFQSAEQQRYHLAVNLLSSFVETFPGDKRVPDAKVLIETLTQAFKGDQYTIGCMLPLSGAFKVFGDRALQGLELALSEVGNRHGFPPFKLIIKDTESDPDKAVEIVKQMAEDNVIAIIGPIATAQSAALQAEKEGIPIITFTQKEGIADIGNFVFRNFLTPRMQVETLVSYVIDEMGLYRFAVLYPDETYGRTFLSLFDNAVARHGGTVVTVEAYQPDQTDFALPIKKIVRYQLSLSDTSAENREYGFAVPTTRSGIDALFIPDAPSKAGLILPQLVYHDLTDIQLLGTNLWHSDTLIRLAGENCQNAVMPDLFFAESSTEQVQIFVHGFESTYQRKPDFIAAITYDTAAMLFEQLSLGPMFFRSAFKEKLLSMPPYNGVTGLTSFEPNGEAQKQLYLLQIREEQFVALPPSDSGPASGIFE